MTDAAMVLRLERCCEEMVRKIKDAQMCTDHGSLAFMSFEASLHAVKAEWRSLFDDRAAWSAADALTDETVHLRNANLVLRRRLQRHSQVARQLYAVLAGDPPPALASSVDHLMEDTLSLANKIRDGMMESQMASAAITLPKAATWQEEARTPRQQSDAASDGALSSMSIEVNPAINTRCLMDFWKLADFKLRHAAQTVTMRIEDLAPGGHVGAEVAMLRVAQLERELEVVTRKSAERVEAQRVATEQRERLLMAEVESLKAEHVAAIERLNAEHRDFNERQQALMADELTVVAADFDLRLQQVLQQARDDASLTAEQLQNDRAQAIDKLRTAMLEERRRHEKTLLRLSEEQQQTVAAGGSTQQTAGSGAPRRGTVTSSRPDSATSAGAPGVPRVNRKPSEQPSLPADIHNSVSIYAEGSAPWTDETKDTLVCLLKEKQVELQMQQATHAVVSKARIMEWESILKDTISRYEGEMQTSTAFLDREQQRTRELLRQLELANHKASTLAFELKAEQSQGKERVEEAERQAREDISIARAEAATARRRIAELEAALANLKELNQHQVTEHEHAVGELQRELQLAREADLNAKLASALSRVSKAVQCDIGGAVKPSPRHATASKGNTSRRGSLGFGADVGEMSLLMGQQPLDGLTNFAVAATESVTAHPLLSRSTSNMPIAVSAPSAADSTQRLKAGATAKVHAAKTPTVAPKKAARESSKLQAHHESVDEVNKRSSFLVAAESPQASAQGAAMAGSTTTGDSAQPSAFGHEDTLAPGALTPQPVEPRLPERVEATMSRDGSSGGELTPLTTFEIGTSPTVDAPKSAFVLPSAAAASPPLPSNLSRTQSKSAPRRASPPDLDRWNQQGMGATSARGRPSSPPLSGVTGRNPGTVASVAEHDSEFEFRAAAHAILSNDVLRDAVRTLPTAAAAPDVKPGDDGIASQVNAATKLPPSVFGIISAHVTAKRFFRALHSMAVICDFALPGTSTGGKAVTNEARLRETAAETRTMDTPPVAPVGPVDVIAVTTFLTRNLVPAPLPRASEQLPGEFKAFTAIGAATERLASFVRSQGFPALLEAVSWEDLERWRFNDREAAVAVAPATVQQFFNATLELLMLHRRYRIYVDKRITQRASLLPASTVVSAAAPMQPNGVQTKPFQPRPPLAVQSVPFLGPDAPKAHAIARPVQHLVDAVEITHRSSTEHIHSVRTAHKRWKALEQRTACPAIVPPLPDALAGFAIAPSLHSAKSAGPPH